MELSKSTTFIIKGKTIDSIADFYSEINRLFMQNESWQLAQSLDAFDDMLYGSYGAIQNFDTVILVWENHLHSKQTLGFDTTLNWYASKLDNPNYNHKFISKEIQALKDGVGKTYYELLLEIIRSHKNINLLLY